QLSLWIKHAREHKQKPFDDFCSMIENNREYIVNYFDGYRTNAIAESINAKIQLATIKNRGSRDLDFFLYRIANFL
ncbi:MAG: transposase, partial [Bacteroidales bacterium]|nr:transposase [Bacteroidales bacterium]